MLSPWAGGVPGPWEGETVTREGTGGLSCSPAVRVLPLWAVNIHIFNNSLTHLQKQFNPLLPQT